MQVYRYSRLLADGGNVSCRRCSCPCYVSCLLFLGLKVCTDPPYIGHCYRCNFGVLHQVPGYGLHGSAWACSVSVSVELFVYRSLDLTPHAPCLCRYILFVLPFQAQLAHERSRDFDGPLEKVTCKTEAKRKELEDQQLKMQELIDSEKVYRLMWHG